MGRRQTLKLKGKTVIFIDRANVYGWKKSLSKPVDPKLLFKYLKKYPEIESIGFYYGTDRHPKSKAFIKEVRETGHEVTTKPVKYINLGKIEGEIIKKRKCDFDIEISMSVYKHLKMDFDTYIFFTGDGDLQPLYRHLIKLGKRVLVIYERGHLGKEIRNIKRGLFKTRWSYLGI